MTLIELLNINVYQICFISKMMNFAKFNKIVEIIDVNKK